MSFKNYYKITGLKKNVDGREEGLIEDFHTQAKIISYATEYERGN